ncbi:PPOX class F420-dependent oxidoreductase [Polymorphospora rubra]|uniref:PPOX class F420-dependent oxidoreductase n=1 Tax=Polymorphospora rubra TaxID=338584 RepID=UPI0031DB3B83
MTDLESLGNEKYVLLTTFRRDGRAVPTPVWAVRDGDSLAVWTVADSGKVKRIRRSGEATVAACDVRGKPHSAAVSARASLIDPASTERVRGLLRKKYGIFGQLVMLGSRIRRGAQGTVGIRIVLVD